MKKLPFDIPEIPKTLPGNIPTMLVIKVVAVVVGVILFGWIGYRILNPKQIAEVRKARVGKVVAAVYGTVNVEPRIKVDVRSRINGVIRSMPVALGDQVKQGDVLAEVVDDNNAHDVQQAQIQLEAAIKRNTLGPDGMSELVAKRSELKQLERLLQEGNIAPIEVDRLKGVVEDLEKRVEQQKVTFAQEVTLAQQNLENLRTKIEQGLIKAPCDGIVLSVFAQPGESILAQTQLFVVGTKDCHLRASVNEEDVGGLLRGMKGVTRLYSYPGKSFVAVVKDILPQGENQSYDVLLDLESPPDKLLPGMTGEINIILGEKEQALIIPTRAIRAGNIVFIVHRGTVEKRTIEPGIRSIEECEVLDGLKEGDLIIISEQDRFRPGESVSVRESGQ